MAGIGKNRCGSTGDCPCLAVTMIVVDSSRSCARNSRTICPIAASTNSISRNIGAAGVPAASVYPPFTLPSINFCPTLTA